MTDQPLRILVYSHRPEMRDAVTNAIGRRPAPDVGKVSYVATSGVGEVLMELDSGGVDLAVLDGEAQPTGGMGLARQLKDELDECPPLIVAIRRADDRWLATWSRAEAVLVQPLDPITAGRSVAELLRNRHGSVTAS